MKGDKEEDWITKKEEEAQSASDKYIDNLMRGSTVFLSPKPTGEPTLAPPSSDLTWLQEFPSPLMKGADLFGALEASEWTPTPSTSSKHSSILSAR
jgi:hypothetical protein